MSDLQSQLAEKMEQVQWHGEYFSAICLFPHNGYKETHPSMLVYSDGYTCLGCKRSGSLKYLVSLISRMSLKETIKITKPNILPKWRKWGYKYGDIEEIADEAHDCLLRWKGHQDFFRRRKIDQFIKQGQFGYLDGWALFPVMEENRKVIDIVVRATKGKGGTKYVVRSDKGRITPNVYVPNWKRFMESDTVYVPYGIIDAWAFESIGLACLTGTTGQSLSPERLKPYGKDWIIVPDRDEEDAAYNLANQLGWRAEVKRVKYPSGMKDCDEIRMKLGAEELKGYLKEHVK